MNTVNFTKMQALGNDFIVIDARDNGFSMTPAQIRRICDRRLGIGCDQLIVLEHSPEADIFMRIYNADGSQSGACGNATRCVADIALRESGKDRIGIETVSGLLECLRADARMVTVDMGAPRLNWDEIPLASTTDTIHLDIGAGPFAGPVAVNMGNPHAVFFVADIENQPVTAYGSTLENHEIFPERANIEFAEVLDASNIRMRVWERGAGVTLACGSGACATAVAAIRRGLTDRKVKIHMDGGPLDIEWRETDGHVLMTGGFDYVFKGQYFL